MFPDPINADRLYRRSHPPHCSLVWNKNSNFAIKYREKFSQRKNFLQQCKIHGICYRFIVPIIEPQRCITLAESYDSFWLRSILDKWKWAIKDKNFQRPEGRRIIHNGTSPPKLRSNSGRSDLWLFAKWNFFRVHLYCNALDWWTPRIQFPVNRQLLKLRCSILCNRWCILDAVLSESRTPSIFH